MYGFRKHEISYLKIIQKEWEKKEGESVQTRRSMKATGITEPLKNHCTLLQYIYLYI